MRDMDLMVAKWQMSINLLVLEMNELEVILRIVWLNKYHVTIDYIAQVLHVAFPNKEPSE